MQLSSVHMNLEDFRALYYDGAGALSPAQSGTLLLLMQTAEDNAERANELAQSVEVDATYEARLCVHIEYMPSK